MICASQFSQLNLKTKVLYKKVVICLTLQKYEDTR